MPTQVEPVVLGTMQTSIAVQHRVVHNVMDGITYLTIQRRSYPCPSPWETIGCESTRNVMLNALLCLQNGLPFEDYTLVEVPDEQD